MDASAPKLDQQRPLAGDTLVLLGALAYAACNVAQEKLLRAFLSTKLFLHHFGLGCGGGGRVYRSGCRVY